MHSNSQCSALRLQVEIYGTFRFLTCINDINLEIQSLYEYLEEELFSNYAVHFKILIIKDGNHIALPVNSKVKDCLKNMDQVYLFVRFKTQQERKQTIQKLFQQQKQSTNINNNNNNNNNNSNNNSMYAKILQRRISNSEMPTINSALAPNNTSPLLVNSRQPFSSTTI
ncbi:hypothetical protein PPL_01376 [Heterostelium album PN500]|uniref:Uncharacterized protein n=1 Tax=Heterostelium pallidum (strain ATCC 26659 / Pp 5 / PN500) TaxID=670386 RepID=D3AZ36_HETP5|nr:hypothetical protein PPL_01376 [Heterostelium album PN500]EFA85593.1 hypothetical protein PPL_01376 [Heterostelium album PN500]|eukprot:XP_020437700.1 hypothetical protein PPL_01376 [Heterostelium album PN500]